MGKWKYNSKHSEHSSTKLRCVVTYCTTHYIEMERIVTQEKEHIMISGGYSQNLLVLNYFCCP